MSNEGEVSFLGYWICAVFKQGSPEEAEAILERNGDHRCEQSPEFCYVVAYVLAALNKTVSKTWFLKAIPIE